MTERSGRTTFVVASLALASYSASTAFGKLDPWPYVFANLALGTVVLVIAHDAGLTTADLGLSKTGLRKGLIWGGLLAAGIVVLIIGGTFVAAEFSGRGAEGADAVGTEEAPQDLLFKIFVHILFGTALAEEAVFRGGLLALWARSRGAREAMIGSSLAFALWHIGPSIVNEGAKGSSDLGIAVYTAASVVGTFIGGLVLVWLRRRTEGIVAPVLVHAAVNGGLVAAGSVSIT